VSDHLTPPSRVRVLSLVVATGLTAVAVTVLTPSQASAGLSGGLSGLNTVIWRARSPYPPHNPLLDPGGAPNEQHIGLGKRVSAMVAAHRLHKDRKRQRLTSGQHQEGEAGFVSRKVFIQRLESMPVGGTLVAAAYNYLDETHVWDREPHIGQTHWFWIERPAPGELSVTYWEYYRELAQDRAREGREAINRRRAISFVQDKLYEWQIKDIQLFDPEGQHLPS